MKARSKTQSPKPLPTKDDIIRILRENMPELRREFWVTYLGLFGSYVRGEQKKRSDVDLLVEFEGKSDLFRFIELRLHLSKVVGVKVDLAMKKNLKPTIGRFIMSEVEPL